MSDPIRLIDETSSPALAAVLRSASSDVPAQREQQLERITAAAGAVAVGGAGRAASRSRWPRRARWLIVGSALVISGGGLWRSKLAARAPARDVAPRTFEPDARVVMVTPVAAPSSTAMVAAPVVSVRVDDLPAARDALAGSATAHAGALAAQAASAQLPDELTMIEAVRSALAAGQPEQALERLDAYRRAYPRAAFDVEGDVLEVQALASLGRVEAARAKARRFLAAHPGSPYEKRVVAVEAALGGPGGEGAP